jgi:hypothetical protein
MQLIASHQFLYKTPMQGFRIPQSHSKQLPPPLQPELTTTQMDSFTNFSDITTSIPTNEENGGSGGYSYCVVA